MGRSGGLAFGFNPRSIRLDASWGSHGFLGADLFSIELGLTLRFVNIYGPCQQRENYWRQLLRCNLFSLDHIIIGGDLNFSLGFSESWGSSAQIDPITEFMRRLLEQYDLIEIPQRKPHPTWRNRRIGSATLARRLDRFLMKGPLIHHLHSYK